MQPAKSISYLSISRKATGERYLLPIMEDALTFLLFPRKKKPTRLELQHRVLKAAYGGELLLAPHEKDVGYFVLEIGTGTGKRISRDITRKPQVKSILH